MKALYKFIQAGSIALAIVPPLSAASFASTITSDVEVAADAPVEMDTTADDDTAADADTETYDKEPEERDASFFIKNIGDSFIVAVYAVSSVDPEHTTENLLDGYGAIEPGHDSEWLKPAFLPQKGGSEEQCQYLVLIQYSSRTITKPECIDLCVGSRIISSEERIYY